MRNRVLIGFVILSGLFACATRAQAPVQSAEIWHDKYTVLTRVQDGGCTLYILRGKVNSFEGAPVAMVTAHNCN